MCVRDEAETAARLEGGLLRHVVQTPFFGILRGTSAADLQRMQEGGGNGAGDAAAAAAVRKEVSMNLPGGVSGKRLLQAMDAGHVFDQEMLLKSILPLVGQATFLEAYDESGRVLNIVVTRSDGKADPLMCNFLTTPQMLVYSACLASCAIPGVYQPVELLARERDGSVVPYFKQGWLWTDGGLQADLPLARIGALFNVNQFIVSQVNPLAPLSNPGPRPTLTLPLPLTVPQVNPLAPLFVPVDTGMPWLTEALVFLKRQLVGFATGLSELGQGRFVRPFGIRLVDLLMQEYEGTLTIFPHWSIAELLQFTGNFDDARMRQYELDGERAVWPHLQVIRSLCEIEFELDSISTELGEQLAFERFGDDIGPGLDVRHHSEDPLRIPAVSSHASLLSLGVDYGGGGGGGGGGSGLGGGFSGVGSVSMPAKLPRRPWGGPDA